MFRTGVFLKKKGSLISISFLPLPVRVHMIPPILQFLKENETALMLTVQSTSVQWWSVNKKWVNKLLHLLQLYSVLSFTLPIDFHISLISPLPPISSRHIWNYLLVEVRQSIEQSVLRDFFSIVHCFYLCWAPADQLVREGMGGNFSHFYVMPMQPCFGDVYLSSRWVPVFFLLFTFSGREPPNRWNWTLVPPTGSSGTSCSKCITTRWLIQRNLTTMSPFPQRFMEKLPLTWWPKW